MREGADIEVSSFDVDIDVNYHEVDIDVLRGAMSTVRGEVPTAEALGLMLQQGRLLRGFTQRELAHELGIGQKWIWQMENGKPGLLTERLFAMLRATGVRLYAEIDLPEQAAPADADAPAGGPDRG